MWKAIVALFTGKILDSAMFIILAIALLLGILGIGLVLIFAK